MLPILKVPPRQRCSRFLRMSLVRCEGPVVAGQKQRSKPSVNDGTLPGCPILGTARRTHGTILAEASARRLRDSAARTTEFKGPCLRWASKEKQFPECGIRF